MDVQVVDEMLSDLPKFYALAAAEYWTQGSSSGGSNSDVSIGLRVSALDARSPRAMLTILESWERDFRETLPMFGGDEESLRSQRQRKAAAWARSTSSDLLGVSLCGVVEFLRICLHQAKDHPAAKDFCSEIKQIHEQSKAAARLIEDAPTIILCPADVDEEICLEPLRLTDVTAIKCDRCGSEWSYARLLAVAKAAGTDTWQPASIITQYLGVPTRTLNHWAKQRKIRKQGSNFLWSSVVAHIQDSTQFDSD